MTGAWRCPSICRRVGLPRRSGDWQERAAAVFARGLTPTELAGRFGLPDTLPLASHVEQAYLRRLESLPLDSRRLVLTAAAEPLGDVALLCRALDRLWIAPQAGAPAESAGLIALGVQVGFRHPAVRSAAYQSATLEEKHDVHRALADAADPVLDPDRRAWPRGPRDVATRRGVGIRARGLGRRGAGRWRPGGGGRVSRPGGPADERPRAPRTPRARRRPGNAPGRCARRRTCAAGDRTRGADGPPPARPVRPPASADRVRLERGGDARAPARGGQSNLEALDVELGGETYLDAFTTAVLGGGLSRGASLAEVARAVRAAPAPPGRPRPPDLLLGDLALLVTEGRSASTPLPSRLDFLVYPTVQVIPPTRDELAAGKYRSSTLPTNTVIASHAGLPAFTIPVGFTDHGPPVGLELLGTPLAEAKMLQLAHTWERSRQPRRPPDLCRSIPTEALVGQTRQVHTAASRLRRERADAHDGGQVELKLAAGITDIDACFPGNTAESIRLASPSVYRIIPPRPPPIVLSIVVVTTSE
jgi:Amidase